jgi:hypothetical protein
MLASLLLVSTLDSGVTIANLLLIAIVIDRENNSHRLDMLIEPYHPATG